MSTHATPAEPTIDPGAYAADARHHREVLNELIDMGADLARLLHKQATTVGWVSEAQPTITPPPDASLSNSPQNPQSTPTLAATTPDLTLAFDRIARCVRRTVLLARRIAEPMPAGPAEAAAGHRVAARRKIIRDVEDAIGRAAQAAPKSADAGALNAELHDRLDAPELDDDIRRRPVADIVADICRDLGIAAAGGAKPWKRRTPADIGALCARAAAPANPPGAATPAPARPKPPAPRAIPAGPRPPRPATDPPPTGAENLPRDPAAAVATLLRYAARPP